MVVTTAAHAQTPSSSTVTAEALFEDGRQLMTQGKYAEACPKFAASERLDPSTATLLNLASCYERQGRTATAWATYKEAASAANAAGRNDYLVAAERHASGLEANLARLTLNVDQPVEGLHVERDGGPVDRAEWGISIPVDPGSHSIAATAPGHKGLGIDSGRDPEWSPGDADRTRSRDIGARSFGAISAGARRGVDWRDDCAGRSRSAFGVLGADRDCLGHRRRGSGRSRDRNRLRHQRQEQVQQHPFAVRTGRRRPLHAAGGQRSKRRAFSGRCRYLGVWGWSRGRGRRCRALAHGAPSGVRPARHFASRRAYSWRSRAPGNVVMLRTHFLLGGALLVSGVSRRRRAALFLQRSVGD